MNGNQQAALLNLDMFDKDGRSILFYSIVLDNTGLLNRLIQAGADINQQDKLRWTTLHLAIQRNNLPAIEILLQSEVDFEIKEKYGNTSLWRAVLSSEGKGDTIKLLLNFGADGNNKNDSGTSPIELARAIANYDIIQFF